MTRDSFHALTQGVLDAFASPGVVIHDALAGPNEDAVSPSRVSRARTYPKSAYRKQQDTMALAERLSKARKNAASRSF